MTVFKHVTRINVLTGEFDDHVKNFSFRLKQGGAWEAGW